MPEKVPTETFMTHWKESSAGFDSFEQGWNACKAALKTKINDVDFLNNIEESDGHFLGHTAKLEIVEEIRVIVDEL